MNRKRITILIVSIFTLFILILLADYFYFINSGSNSAKIESAEFKQNSRDIPVSPEDYDRNSIYLRQLTFEEIPSEMIQINCYLYIQIDNESKLFPLQYIPEKDILILSEEISQMEIPNFEHREYFFKMQILFSTDHYQTLNNISKASILTGKLWIDEVAPNQDQLYYEFDQAHTVSDYFGMSFGFNVGYNITVKNPYHIVPFFKFLY